MDPSEPAKAKYKLNPEPTISANQLAEYLLAAPAKRQTIIKNAKYAPTAIVARYKKAKEAICEYLSSEIRDKRILYDAELQLYGIESSTSAWSKDDARLSIEAIKEFYSVLGNSQLVSLNFKKLDQKLTPLVINGVTIKVTLDLLSHQKNKHGDRIGGVLFQVSKTVTSSTAREEHGRNVATLIWLLVNEKLSDKGFPEKNLCIAFDVFGKHVWTTPTSYKRRIQNIEAACSEIKMFWNVIPTPPGFTPA